MQGNDIIIKLSLGSVTFGFGKLFDLTGVSIKKLMKIREENYTEEPDNRGWDNSSPVITGNYL